MEGRNVDDEKEAAGKNDDDDNDEEVWEKMWRTSPNILRQKRWFKNCEWL